MRFASIGGQGNYAQAGKAVANDAAKTFQAARRNSVDFEGLAASAMKNKSNENIAQIRADTFVKKAEIKEEGRKAKMGAAKAGVMRKAGVLAATGIAGLAEKPEKRDYSLYDKKLAGIKAKNEADRATMAGIDTTGKKTETPANTGGTGASNVSTTAATGSGLTGKRKELADAIAGPESGSWGYEAFNQGGAAGGTKVLGKSGSHKETYGTSLSDMTLGQIFHKQNTKQRGMSLDEHYKSGGLHAVGRYQFIGSTLQDEVARMGLSHDTKFTPQVQDDIFFSHIKRVGNISPWVGPSVNYGQGKKDHLNGLISQI
jgi:hypothetical protein